MVNTYVIHVSATLTTSRQECEKRVKHVFDDSIFQKVDSWATTIAIYRLAYNDGTSEVIPISNGHFDLPFCTVPSSNGHHGTGQFNIPHPGHRSRVIVAPYILRRPTVETGTYYVVVHGEEVGVFRTWYVFSSILSSLLLCSS